MSTHGLILGVVVGAWFSVGSAGAQEAQDADTKSDADGSEEDVVLVLTFEDGSTKEGQMEAQGPAYLFVEPKVGWFIPTTRLEAAPTLAVGTGFLVVPAMKLWLMGEVGWTRPSAEGSVSPLDGGAPVGYEMATSDLSLLLGARKVFDAPWAQLPKLEPFVEAGVKLHWLNTKVDGGVIADETENDLAVGGAGKVGALYRLGPGAATASLELNYTRYEQELTGGANVLSLSPMIGYHLAF